MVEAEEEDREPPANQGPKLSAADTEGVEPLPVKEEQAHADDSNEFEAGFSPYEDTMTSLTNAESDRTDHMTDDEDDEQSSGSEAYDDGDLLASAMDDDVTAQLAAAGWQYKHANGDFHFFAFSKPPLPPSPPVKSN